MKTRYLISLAALALMMGSCSSEVNQESAQEAGTQTIPFSATISNKSETRGLTEDATTQTGSATITGTLTGVK